MNIIVLKGGISSEREVSLVSGKIIADTLRENQHQVTEIDTVLPMEQLEKKLDTTENHLRRGNSNLLKLLHHDLFRNCDFVFNALHGGEGENGEVQSLLMMHGMKFNGSDSTGCAISMDKIISKLIFERYNIPTPKWEHFNRGKEETIEEMVRDIEKNLAYPVVVKPANEGSTVGLTIVNQPEKLTDAIHFSRKFSKEVLVEEFIPGRELTVALLDNRALPVVEIIPKHQIYDYECKYADGMSEYLSPAPLPQELTRRIQAYSLLGFKALKCSGYGRMDLRLSPDNKPYFLELNALPGMTSHSLVPKAAKAAGIPFSELLEIIIETGLRNGR
ncbi:MAG: D-alanine--D-alanine ligase [Candidatus Marinimicrobia bacterium]|nr:D-alanine--D-alanine ligase [Candidatus Neomarinimicrobiota bacterium]